MYLGKPYVDPLLLASLIPLKKPVYDEAGRSNLYTPRVDGEQT